MPVDEAPFSWNCNSLLNIFSAYNELAVLAVDKKKNQGSREWHEKKKKLPLYLYWNTLAIIYILLLFI